MNEVVARIVSGVLSALKNAFSSVRSGRQRRIRIAEKASLGQKGFVALLQVDDNELVIAVLGERLTVLAHHDQHAELNNSTKFVLKTVDASATESCLETAFS